MSAPHNDMGPRKAWAMVPDLQRLVTSAQLAARHGVSERTVYRYLNYLRASGVDVISQSGMGHMLGSNKFFCPHCGTVTTLSALRRHS